MLSASSTTPAAVDAARALRDAGLRVTKPRTAVMGALAATPHASADDVFAAISGVLPGTSRQAVYNVLGDLSNHGLARRIEPAGSPVRYELRVGDNHHHLVCRSCGMVADIDCPVGAAPCLAPRDTDGFLIDQAEVTYWGTCADCQTAARSTASAAAAATTPMTVPHIQGESL